MRYDQKLTVFNFFKKYLFIYQKVSCPLQSNPPQIIHSCQGFFQSSKHFRYALFGIANSFDFDFSFISSIVAERFSFFSVFSFVRKKKSAGAKSGEYGDWGMITVLFLAENSRTSIDVWAGALSWCKIHD